MKLFNDGINLFMLNDSRNELFKKKYSSFKETKVNNNQELISFLESNKILPFGAHRLSKYYNESVWTDIHTKYFIRNKLVLSETVKVFLKFSSNSVENAVLYENFGTLLLTNSCLSCFSSSDIDIYAIEKEKIGIDKSLKELGYYKCIKKSIDDRVLSVYRNDSVLENESFNVNIAWKIVTRRYIPHFNLLRSRTDILLKETEVLDNGIRVFNNEAMFYVNLLHISLGHYYTTSPGVRLFYDIDILANDHGNLDVNKVLNWAKKDKQLIRVYTVIRLTNELLDTKIMYTVITNSKVNNYSNKILKYLWKKKNKTYITKEKSINQIVLDSLSEGQFLIIYLIRRLISRIGAK